VNQQEVCFLLHLHVFRSWQMLLFLDCCSCDYQSSSSTIPVCLCTILITVLFLLLDCSGYYYSSYFTVQVAVLFQSLPFPVTLLSDSCN